ncbi:type II toxin-antitoxin system RelE/ParE family toxin [Dyadobacter sp. CY261]|uniref:type II toxin-antitoxin system RelE/ParE family toxin n=1 Tax=Dyadobacter sp. CY261 TaxID=2907203 RepID=UPI001F446118|nr:type II toxin-antitoxin system RelE/ParE family toxin [Dyadobacter sp. CY261]MCF0074439.1 type II toxin-antitoxin system RelE/ParE family toxin [Dyadobacter sp. CY261]
MGSYRLARRAESDLEDIWGYTETTWSTEQAEKYLDGLFNCFQSIADGRAKAKSIDAIRVGYSKTPFVKHNIYFRKAPHHVIEIVRILHVSMDAESHLLSFEEF